MTSVLPVLNRNTAAELPWAFRVSVPSGLPTMAAVNPRREHAYPRVPAPAVGSRARLPSDSAVHRRQNDWAATPPASAACMVPDASEPGGKPVTEVPGLTRLPVTTVEPVFVYRCRAKHTVRVRRSQRRRDLGQSRPAPPNTANNTSSDEKSVMLAVHDFQASLYRVSVREV